MENPHVIQEGAQKSGKGSRHKQKNEMEMSIQTSKIYLRSITNTLKKPIYISKNHIFSKNPPTKGIYKQEN